MTRQAVLEKVKELDVTTPMFLEYHFDLSRSNIRRHLRALEAQGLIHEACKVWVGRRHSAWAYGPPRGLTPVQCSTQLYKQLQGVLPIKPIRELVCLTPWKTVFANGINPWTQQVSH